MLLEQTFAVVRLENVRGMRETRTKIYETINVRKFGSDSDVTSIGESDKLTSARKAS